MALIAAVCAGLAVLLLGWPSSVRVAANVTAWAEVLTPQTGRTSRERRRRPPMWVKLIPPAVEASIRRARRVPESEPDPLAQNLAYARLQDVISPEQFIGLRVLAPIGLFVGLYLIYLLDPAPFRLVLAFAGALVGVALPDHWLKQQIKRRQEAIRRELPSVLTTLGVLLDAGLNLGPALQEVVQRKEGALSEVIRDALRQTTLGTPIQDALQAGAAQCGVQELTLFVSVLTQAMAKGASGVSEAVRGQSRQIWALRQQQVQEKGQELSRDLFLILMFLAFPAMALFLLGPVGLSLYDTFFK